MKIIFVIITIILVGWIVGVLFMFALKKRLLEHVPAKKLDRFAVLSALMLVICLCCVGTDIFGDIDGYEYLLGLIAIGSVLLIVSYLELVPQTVVPGKVYELCGDLSYRFTEPNRVCGYIKENGHQIGVFLYDEKLYKQLRLSEAVDPSDVKVWFKSFSYKNTDIMVEVERC